MEKSESGGTRGGAKESVSFFFPAYYDEKSLPKIVPEFMLSVFMLKRKATRFTEFTSPTKKQP